MAGLYIHIPFCVRKCLYCDFYSLPTGRGPIARRLSELEMERQPDFLDALAVELGRLPEDFRPETVFIGGGTPTELSDEDFARLFELIRKSSDLSEVSEFTCESNPGTLTPAKVDIMIAGGVNRVSLGVQSLTPSVLEFIGRIHSPEEAVAGYQLLREKGVANINLDFMYGIPGQTLAHIEEDLARAIALGPEHIACYCLIFEDGTPLTELRNKGYLKEVDDDAELEQFQMVRTILTRGGYGHYEISNYAKPGFESAHNKLYWSAGEYIGCGPSAHSHWRGRRYGNIRNLEEYNRRLLAGDSVLQFEEQLSSEARAREALVMYLRRIDGVGRDEFRAATGFDYEELCHDPLCWLESINMIDRSAGRLRLTPQGVFVSDAVYAELV
ncbi:MAG: radical SAM family heme chaperone HemW [Kiritimatiellia bacterium]